MDIYLKPEEIFLILTGLKNAGSELVVEETKDLKTGEMSGIFRLGRAYEDILELMEAFRLMIMQDVEHATGAARALKEKDTGAAVCIWKRDAIS